MSEYARYVWRDRDDIPYKSWEDMDLEHHRSVVAYLRRKATSLRRQWKAADMVDKASAAAVEEVWRSTLLILEETSIALAKRLEETDWELDTPPIPVVKRKQKVTASAITGEALRKVRFSSG